MNETNENPSAAAVGSNRLLGHGYTRMAVRTPRREGHYHVILKDGTPAIARRIGPPGVSEWEITDGPRRGLIDLGEIERWQFIEA